jgi:oligosaccharyltransferase complex subunit alpha (ribophorin I)
MSIILKFLALCLVIGIINADSSADLVNTKVERLVDISSHLVYITNKINVENTGSSAQKSYTFVVEPSKVKHVSIVSAQLSGPKTKKTVELEARKLNVVKIGQESARGQLYKIEFKSDLAAGKPLNFEVEVVLFDELSPFPTEITQAEKQLVLYEGNHYYYSMYKTTKQTTEVKLASEKTESYTQTLKPFSKSGSHITYGPYANVKPFEQNDMKVHYENNSPFLRVTQLTRTIEISHWGNIAVEETIDLSHYGATLKGPFSRFEFMRKQGGSSSVKSITSLLPTLATDAYYRDEIGNISTSNLRSASKKSGEPLDFELRPRFPLFGGWKTHYMIGYNLPAYQYLFTNGNDYLLKMKLIDNLYADQLVESATIKIILPEHSTDLNFVTPYTVERGEDQLHFTYLDTVGRPVVVVHIKNTVENHIQDFQLKYKFQKMMILKEPLVLVATFFAIFAFIILVVRIDFSIAHNKPIEHAKKE